MSDKAEEQSTQCSQWGQKQGWIYGLLCLLSVFGFTLGILNKFNGLHMADQLSAVKTELETLNRLHATQFAQHQHLLTRLTQIIDQPRRLAERIELESLVQFADDALTLQHDVKLAITLLNVALARLQNWSPAAPNIILIELNQTIQALKAVPSTHLDNIAYSLTLLANMIEHREVLAQQPEPKVIHENQDAKPNRQIPTTQHKRWQKWLERARQSIADVVTLSRVTPIHNMVGTPTQSDLPCEQHLLAAISTAQLAVSLRNDGIYQSALANLTTWLNTCPNAIEAGKHTLFTQSLYILKKYTLRTTLPTLKRLIKIIDEVTTPQYQDDKASMT